MGNGDWYQRERLHRAAQQGDLAEVAELLDRGFDANVFDEIGKTPLHYAAAGEHADVVSLLLRRGARVDAQHEPTVGNTPLVDVAGRCSLDMARLLLEAGADPTIRGWMQLNALDRAKDRRDADGQGVFALLHDASRRKPA